MHADSHLGIVQNWFTDAFLPWITPELLTPQQRAALEVRNIPAPQTEAKMRTWTLDDLWEAIAQRGQVSQYILASGMPGSTVGSESPPPPVKCPWHESYKNGECKFGSTALWIALGGGVALFVFMRRP
jgi:hypothetical protein